MRKDIRKISYYIISVLILIGSLTLSAFTFRKVFMRTVISFRDLGTSIAYYFCFLFDMQDKVKPTVLEIPLDFANSFFPIDFEVFRQKMSLYFDILFSKANFTNFMTVASELLMNFCLFLTMFIPLILVVRMIFLSNLKTQNNNYAEESKALKNFKRFEETVLKNILTYIKGFWNFVNETVFFRLFVLIWLYNFNIFSIIISSLSFYFFFVCSFNFQTVYTMIVKLLIDLSVYFGKMPLPVTLFFAYLLICYFRKKIAIQRLEHQEAKNTGFVNGLGAVTVIFGLCGGGKGTVMTDITLTMDKCYRHNAKETLQKFDLYFPHFPFIKFEKYLQKMFRTHTIYSLATIELFIENRKRLFYNSQKMFFDTDFLWGYDYKKYGLTFDNKLYIVDLFEALDTYAKAYYIYTLPALVVSNYAIRSDGFIEDCGNFPIWNFDFFDRKSEELDEISNYGKILDQDVIRKGKHVKKDNPLIDTLEVGIVVMTELDKDRGNQNDTKDVKGDADSANQKNDKFNFTLKLDRHPSTVDYKYYLKILCDLQRTMKTEADIRESGDNMGVGDKDSDLLAMPFFFIEEFLYGLISDRFFEYYETYRYYHGDTTLSMYLIKKICGKFINYYRNVYNQFGYEVQHLKIIKDGNPDGVPEVHDYYLAYKKIRSKRYSTDSFADYFRKSALKQKMGLIDYPEYSGVRATREELNKQNSYFIRTLEHLTDEEK